MQSRGTVQHNRMLFDYFFKHIPYLWLKSLDHFLCIFNIVCCSVRYKLFHNEWLEQLDCHLFRQTTLIDLQFWSNDDNRTSRIVNTFSKQVLTETSGLTFQHVRQRLECSVSRSCYRTSTTSVIDQRINSFLKHTLLVSYDNIWCSQFKESSQTVISVNDSSVQIIQVRCCKTSSIQLYHRTQIRRDNRDSCKDHPLRSVSGLAECFYNFQTFYNSRTLLSCCILQACLKFCIFFLKINRLKKLFDGFSTHTYTECMSSPFFLCFLILCL